MPLSAVRVERAIADLQHGRFSLLEGRSQFDDLCVRTREAAAWCVRHLDPAAIGTSLRPTRLAPRPLPPNRWWEVDDVVNARRRELADVPDLGDSHPRGRLLVYFPDANLADGAADLASGGFFDIHNAPPWGTWIGYFDDRGKDLNCSCYLLAWVPEAVVAAAGAGIYANPEACIAWFADAAVALRSALQPSQLWDAG